MNKMNLPSAIVFADVLFFVLFLIRQTFFDKKSKPKCLTQNKNKNINKVHAELYGT